MTPRMRTFFFTSVLLNVLLTGVLLGMVFTHMGPDHHRWYDEKALASLPPEVRERFENTMKKSREDNKVVRDKIRALREEMRAILSAEQFDEGAYQQRMDQMHALRGEMMQNMANGIKEIARDLPADQRAKIAESFARKGKSRWEQCGHKSPMDKKDTPRSPEK